MHLVNDSVSVARPPEHFSMDVVREAFGTPLAGYTIALEAWRRGLGVRLLDGQMRRYVISSKHRSVKFDKARPSTTTSDAIKVTKSKFETSSHLRHGDVPVPLGRIIDPKDPSAGAALLREAAEIGYPVVLKPLLGSMGRDVYTNIQTPTDLEETYGFLTGPGTKPQTFVLEEHCTGEDYRVLVVGDRVTAACLRRPANVVGDGAHTVEELISLKNQLRAQNPYLSAKPIVVDREVTQLLERHGWALDSVPVAGQTVMLREKANASQGGDSLDRTDELPDVVKDAAVRAVAAIPGLFMAGVDVLYDETRQPGGDSFRVIELNSRPEIEINMYPWVGEGRDAPRDIIDQLFPETPRSENPLLASTALNVPTMLAPLREAIADEVILKRKPSHSYPCRLSYAVGRNEPLSGAKVREVLVVARQTRVAGHAVTSGNEAQVIVCGTEDNVRDFVRKAGRTLGIKAESARPWDGVVAQGFTIDN